MPPATFFFILFCLQLCCGQSGSGDIYFTFFLSLYIIAHKMCAVFHFFILLHEVQWKLYIFLFTDEDGLTCGQ